MNDWAAAWVFLGFALRWWTGCLGPCEDVTRWAWSPFGGGGERPAMTLGLLGGPRRIPTRRWGPIMTAQSEDRLGPAGVGRPCSPDRRRFLRAAGLGAGLFPALAGPPRAGDPPPFTGHRGPVTGLAFAADGRTLLSGGKDGAVRLWTAAGRPLGAWSGEHREVLAVALARRGRAGASAGYGRTVVWALPAGRPRHRFDAEFARREGRAP